MSVVPPPAAHCTGCGRVPPGCPGGCGPALDPPRFCADCGRRLSVQVFPGHVVARCGHGHDQGSPASPPR